MRTDMAKLTVHVSAFRCDHAKSGAFSYYSELKLCSYRQENTPHFHYKNQLTNIYRSNHCLFSEPNEYHEEEWTEETHYLTLNQAVHIVAITL
jgi:hypothetical protein